MISTNLRSLLLLMLGLMMSVFGGEPLLDLDGVWNHAYQENWEPDDVPNILEGARNAYVLLDAFDDPEAREAIPSLKAAGNTVAVYMSVGTGEDWRHDFDRLRPHLVERAWGAWPGEYFIDRVDDTVVEVMKARIDLAASWGADYVEFDNMDWAFDSRARRRYGFNVTEEESLTYINMLRTYAESLGVLSMAKNMTVGAESFAGVTFESWSDEMDWWDRGGLKSFLAAGKICVVFHYNERNPEEAIAFYQELYGENLLILVETRDARGYEH